MKDETPIYELKENERFCYLLGCSGMDEECPGNPNCSIIKKVRHNSPPKR